MNDTIAQGKFEESLYHAEEKEAAEFWYGLKANNALDTIYKEIADPYDILAKVYALVAEHERDKRFTFDLKQRETMRLITLGNIQALLEYGVNGLIERKALERIESDKEKEDE